MKTNSLVQFLTFRQKHPCSKSISFLDTLLYYVAKSNPKLVPTHTVELRLKKLLQQHQSSTAPLAALQPLRSDLSILLLDSKQTRAQQYLAIDCEMVGVGPNGCRSALARVSIVDFHGTLILDSYVKPKERVTQYRTWVSGIKPEHLADADSFKSVTQKVAELIENKVLIGHAIHNDLQVLSLAHPPRLIRDTSTYGPLGKIAKTDTPSLRKLASLLLGLKIQKDAHCSIDDARATMAVYRTQHNEWEDTIMRQEPPLPIVHTPLPIAQTFTETQSRNEGTKTVKTLKKQPNKPKKVKDRKNSPAQDPITANQLALSG